MKDFELIIIDDGSKDNSKEIIKKYQNNKKIKSIFQKNREQTEANIEKLSSYLDQTNVNLIERKDCKEGILGFFHYKNIQQPEIVICINNFDSKDRNLYWKTLVHESVHVAQACNGGLLSNEEEFKYKVGQLTGFSMISPRNF